MEKKYVILGINEEGKITDHVFRYFKSSIEEEAIVSLEHTAGEIRAGNEDQSAPELVLFEIKEIERRLV